MKTAAFCLLGLAVALGLFAVWGLFTAAGQRRFDEMDGMYPFGAGVLALILALIGGVIWFLGRS